MPEKPPTSPLTLILTIHSYHLLYYRATLRKAVLLCSVFVVHFDGFYVLSITLLFCISCMPPKKRFYIYERERERERENVVTGGWLLVALGYFSCHS